MILPSARKEAPRFERGWQAAGGGPWKCGARRVKFGGELSDMVNLSRAKDAAVSMVLRELNADYGADTRKKAPNQ